MAFFEGMREVVEGPQLLMHALTEFLYFSTPVSPLPSPVLGDFKSLPHLLCGMKHPSLAVLMRSSSHVCTYIDTHPSPALYFLIVFSGCLQALRLSADLKSLSAHFVQVFASVGK